MDQQKYIRLKELHGINDVFILFPPAIGHNNVAFKMGISDDNLISAGFVQNIVKNGKREANCHGKSVSLKVESQPEDTGLLNKQHYTHDESQKYIRVECFDFLDDAIFLFPEDINHADFFETLKIPKRGIVSAGFVSNNIGKEKRLNPQCHGHSFSLDRPSFGEDDTIELIRQHYSFLASD